MAKNVTIHPVVKRSVVIGGHKTSLSLEEPFWNGLRRMAARQNKTIADVVAGIDRSRDFGNLSSAIRQIVLADVVASAASPAPAAAGTGAPA